MKTFDEEQGGAGGERLGRFDVVANTNLQIKLVDRLFLLESRFFFLLLCHTFLSTRSMAPLSTMGTDLEMEK